MDELHTLAIETSSMQASIALGAGKQIVCQRQLPPDQHAGCSLLPQIQDALAEARWTPGSLSMVSVTSGPGSFTGLRIGVTAAKTLAYALRIDLVAINTLELIAWQTLLAHRQHAGALAAVVDAQRRQLYFAAYRPAPSGIDCVHSTEIVDQTDLKRWVDNETLLAGPPLIQQPQWKPPCPTADATCWQPQAAALCQLAYQKYCAGVRDDLWSLVPRYYRPSAAEERKS